MKPIIERLNKAPKSSFVIQKDIFPHYPTTWHHHPEYELVLVVKSTGKKVIGDQISNFTDGDLTLMGPFLPHVYHNDKIYYEEDSTLTAEAIVIHFSEDIAGKRLFEIPEFESIKRLLTDSLTGISISGNTRQIVEDKMHKMLELNGALLIIELLSILHLLADTKEKEQIASPGFSENFKPSGSERITKVCDYIMQNFNTDLKLAHVAKVANMSPNAFCSFFKQRTRKTYVNFLNEIRVGYACRLLIENQYNISEICYKSGFQNLSNFNRQFKKIQNKTPIQYKNDIVLINS